MDNAAAVTKGPLARQRQSVAFLVSWRADTTNMAAARPDDQGGGIGTAGTLASCNFI
jgi:hypothetical protein